MPAIVGSVLFGAVMVGVGGWGIVFTYQHVAREQITTPEDASIPNAPVRGPLTLLSQADVIRKHTLESTGGLTYAQMPRQVPEMDANGNQVLDENGAPVMVANDDREIWITATTLTNALNLAVLAYAISMFVCLLGMAWMLGGWMLSRSLRGN